MNQRITNLHITRQAERLSRNLGVRVAAGRSDYNVWRCHVGDDADTAGNGYTIAVVSTARELFEAMYAANNALEFVQLQEKDARAGGWGDAATREMNDKAAYERLISDAAAGDPGEQEEHKYLLPRDEDEA